MGDFIHDAYRNANLTPDDIDTGALIVTGKAAAPWIAVGFASQDSNLALQTGFPVFVGNALDWLSDAALDFIDVAGLDGYYPDEGSAANKSRR